MGDDKAVTEAPTEIIQEAAEQHAAPMINVDASPEVVAQVSQLIDAEQTTPEAVEPEPIAVADAEAEIEWHRETVKRGDNLSLIFKRAGLNDSDLHELISSCKEAKQLKRLHPGQAIDFHIAEGQLQELRYQTDQLSSANFRRDDASFIAETLTREPDLKPSYHEGTINSSLFLAGQNAGLSDALIMEMANIFGWDVDFVLDIRQGDSFRVMYDEKYLDGKHIGNGPILAAEFTNKDKTFKAVRYTHENGSSHYYTPDGDSMRKEFLRTPVDFARISSHFNLRRKHPVLNRIRAHKGTDYAAPRGTPIRAAGDGKVVHAGRKGGYGKAVILKHGGAYKTLYAHMSRYGKGIKNGKRVKQGQIIGYVGSTGLATGPHLHYEFHVNGRVRNPVTVKLPKARSIPKAEAERFKKLTQPMLAQMGDLQAARQIASLEKTPNTL
ncbi:peptidoglycan DD-metalloendopeptidase family protein [Pseudoteredinibacter isoporae]|nr:peptidoglycan DD-metalloendopeptidase family protein [Pseudoteredinibacter isoporae]NIB26243.1 peptidoglycan DD-metalloendopeptidase family protein [Pseudoteredinibacter isoporae]